MSGLRDYLFNQDIGVSISGNKVHIGASVVECALAIAEGLHVVVPTTTAAGVATVGVGTVLGIGTAAAGPVVGMAGVFMAMGSGYEKAREEIQNEAVASGFSQGFVAGILNMSPTTTSSLFGQHGVIQRHAMDPQADVLEMKAHNRGVVAGYILANQASEDQKKSFVFEIREFTVPVSAGAWGDREKRDYVIEYAAKLRLHFLQEQH